MAALPKGPVPSLLQDLKVTILSSTRLCPPQPYERRSMFLSNIDQVLNFNVETVHFFAGGPDFPLEAVVERLKAALERLLVPYDFLAGRLRVDSAHGSTGRLEIDCNAQGMGFVVASSELSLLEIGELEYPNPAFRQLAVFDPPDSLCTFQVTSFTCGSFAIGISNNHTTFDGVTFKLFLCNLAAVTAGNPLATTPCNDRRLLAARSPPRVEFPHAELVQLDEPPPSPPVDGQPPLSSTILDAASDKLEFKLFRLNANDIAALKTKAGGAGPAVTGFNVVTAHLWRCKALAAMPQDKDMEKTSTILYAVDIRPRLRPPLPYSYTGNAVLSAPGAASRLLLQNGPFTDIVKFVSQASAMMDDAYARSVIDWGELHKGHPRADMFVSSWWKLGLAEVEYPWGKPVYCCPVVRPSMDIVLLFPGAGGASKGVNVLVAVPPDHMQRFADLFYKFLA